VLGDTFLPGAGILHRADPRAKTVVLVGVGVLALVPTGVAPSVTLATVAVLVSTIGIGLREAFRPLRASIPLLVLLVALTPLFYPGGALLLGVGGLRYLTDRGLVETARILCRFVSLAVACYAYFRTTETGDLLATGRWFGLPYGACLVLGVAVRLVPSTAALYLGVLDALSLRRASPGGRRQGAGAELRRVVPAVTAVLVHSVRSIPVLSMALETRGVGRRNPRTATVDLGPTRRMVVHLTLGAAAVGVPFVAALFL
jgi:energy-coupling factor transport system permease protein